MCLGVSTSVAKNIGYLDLVVREVIFINFKLILQLKFPIVECKVSPVCK